jgi:hypothetical protein
VGGNGDDYLKRFNESKSFLSLLTAICPKNAKGNPRTRKINPSPNSLVVSTLLTGEYPIAAKIMNATKIKR